MRMPILLLLLSTTVAAHAQQVYKCANGKDVAYQSRPCDEPRHTIRQWDATPNPPPATMPVATARQPTASKATRTTKPRRSSSGNGNARPRIASADARCNAAKARREAKLKAVGLDRTFDLLRRLDDAVHEACK